MGKGPPHIVILSFPGFDQLLELRHNPVPAAVSGIVHPAAVMDFLPSVQAEHHVAHFPVGKIDDVIVNQHAVGGQGEAEILVLFLLDAAGISHQLLHHVKIHQRFAAEEVHFQVAAGAGMGHKEIQGLFSHLVGHNSPVPVILALAGKAVGAVQVAGMRDVKAQGLDHAGGLLLQFSGHGLKHVRREQGSLFLQGGNLIPALPDFRGILPETGGHFRNDLLPGFLLIAADDLIGDLIHHMHRPGAGVNDDIPVVQMITMNHFLSPIT